MSEHELELHRRAEQGDVPSYWALAEIAHLVDKANETTRESWELRKRLKSEEPDGH